MKWMLWIAGLLLMCTCLGQTDPPYRVVIHEVLADPTPPRGLPNAEFIELRNISGTAIQLRNWRVSNGSSSGRINSNFLLRPDSLVILTSSGAVSAYEVFGPSLALSPFPAINNEGDTLLLYNSQDTPEHAVAFNKSWYRNRLKEEGGWTVEMKDITRPCLQESNWAASTAAAGGTPGKNNQPDTITTDLFKPSFVKAFLQDSITLLIVMNTPMKATAISLDPGLQIKSFRWIPPLYQTLQLTLATPFPKDSLMKFTINGMEDCLGMPFLPYTIRIGLFARSINSQCVLNEILFDPPSGGSDYLELFNRSAEVIDAGQLYLANRNNNGRLSTPVPLSGTPLPLLPGEYLLITEDSNWVHTYYDPGNISIVQRALPAFPDNEGTVVILNQAGVVVDELNYSAHWHYPLVSSTQGVSLERISAKGLTQQSRNWHSAASTNRYGTPGYRNSQSIPFTPPGGKILTPSSTLISPDQDGFQDILRIKYVLDAPGYIANIDVYNSWGSRVAGIANNELCGLTGEFIWDGLHMQGVQLPRGAYIIHARFHLTNGWVKQEKIPIGVW